MNNKNNLVITIGRSFGSGGREIGRKLADTLGINYYDKELLEKVANESGLSKDYIELFDEKKPAMPVFSILPIGSITNEEQMEIRLQQLQRHVIEKLVEEGPCVFVGRRADLLLHGRHNTYNIFITAPEEYCVARVVQRDGLTEQESLDKIRRMNRNRKVYYNYSGEGRWGEASNYNLCIDSSILGVEGSVVLIQKYIDLCLMQRKTETRA